MVVFFLLILLLIATSYELFTLRFLCALKLLSVCLSIFSYIAKVSSELKAIVHCHSAFPFSIYWKWEIIKIIKVVILSTNTRTINIQINKYNNICKYTNTRTIYKKKIPWPTGYKAQNHIHDWFQLDQSTLASPLSSWVHVCCSVRQDSALLQLSICRWCITPWLMQMLMY